MGLVRTFVCREQELLADSIDEIDLLVDKTLSQNLLFNQFGSAEGLEQIESR